MLAGAKREHRHSMLLIAGNNSLCVRRDAAQRLRPGPVCGGEPAHELGDVRHVCGRRHDRCASVCTFRVTNPRVVLFKVKGPLTGPAPLLRLQSVW